MYVVSCHYSEIYEVILLKEQRGLRIVDSFFAIFHIFKLHHTYVDVCSLNGFGKLSFGLEDRNRGFLGWQKRMPKATIYTFQFVAKDKHTLVNPMDPQGCEGRKIVIHIFLSKVWFIFFFKAVEEELRLEKTVGFLEEDWISNIHHCSLPFP